MLNLSIPNFNNKLAADIFLHIYKHLGNLDPYLMMEQPFQIKDTEGLWLLYDLGRLPVSVIPKHYFIMSHNCDKNKYMTETNCTPETEVYFLIIKKHIAA